MDPKNLGDEVRADRRQVFRDALNKDLDALKTALLDDVPSVAREIHGRDVDDIARILKARVFAILAKWPKSQPMA